MQHAACVAQGMGPPPPRKAQARVNDPLTAIDALSDDQLEALIRDCVEVRGRTQTRAPRMRIAAQKSEHTCFRLHVRGHKRDRVQEPVRAWNTFGPDYGIII